MKSLLIACAGLIFCTGAAMASQPTPPAPQLQKMALEPLPFPGSALEITSGFAGASNGRFLVAGSLPQQKEGLLSLWVKGDSGADAWKEAAQKVPRWAAATQWKQSVICAGGVADQKLTARVLVLTVGTDGALSSAELPPLPKPLAGAGAAILGDRLYVVGGIGSLEEARYENALWSLDLKAPAAGWKSEAPLPAAPRAFAAVTQQYDALCVIGGQTAGTPAQTTRETWTFRPKPPEATNRVGWARMADLPRAVTGAVAFPVGQACVGLIGGSSRPGDAVFPDESQAQTEAPALLFHTITDAWCAFEQPQGLTFARATTLGSGLDLKTILFSNRANDAALQSSEFKVIRTARNLTMLDYGVIVGYFCIIALIGVIASRKHRNSSADFSLGSRQVPWWVAGISMFATGASAISLMSIPALAFSSNLVFLFPTAILILSYFIQSRLIYPLLRRMEITSTYEYLERRFNRTLRLIASAQCILFQTFGRASVVLVLPSLAISATTGIETWKCVLLMSGITMIYTVFGGFNAVVWTDVFQGLLKFLAPLGMILICIFSLPGGPKQFVEIGLTHHKFDFAMFTWDATLPAVWILFLNALLASTIQQAGDQPVIQRVFSAPDKEVRRVAAMFLSCGVLISIVVNVLGIAIFAFFHANPGKLDPLSQNDKIMPLFVIQQLPHGIVGVVVAAIFASAMTTVASSMNSSATVFTEDFFLRWKPDAPDKLRLRVLRGASLIVGLIATGIALILAKQNTKSFMQVWSIIMALLGGGIVGVFSLGMFTKRANGFGAVCGAIASIVITALVQFKTPLHWQTLSPIAILSCIFFGYVFSFFSRHHKSLDGLTIYRKAKPESHPEYAQT